MQEMMKAMMQGQGGDQFDMEEMQSKHARKNVSDPLSWNRNDGIDGKRIGWAGRIGRIGRRDGGHAEDDGHGWRCTVIGMIAVAAGGRP